MAALEAGRKCVLASGRRAGEEVEIVRLLDEKSALVRDKKGKERKAAITLLRPKA